MASVSQGDGNPTITVKNDLGVAATEWTPNRAWVNFPMPRQGVEISNWGLERIWKRARSLYANCSEVRHAVNTLAMMVGTITPRPCSGDEEWDKLARAAFLKRVNNPYLFDVAGVLNWTTAQLWIEKGAIKDGDDLTVLTTAKDGGGSVAFFAAPQITSDGKYDNGNTTGVEVDVNGRATAYHLYDWNTKKSFRVAANRAVLYRHNPDPAVHRGASELISAITTA